MKLDLNKLISKIVITCPICKRIPFLTIIPINILILVRSTCPCFTKTIPLYEYKEIKFYLLTMSTLSL